MRRFKAVVGAPATPTPSGRFAIAELARQPDPDGFLGPFALHLTAHSDVLDDYGGGPGRVAIHGRGGESLADPLGSARVARVYSCGQRGGPVPRAAPRRGGAGDRGLLDSPRRWALEDRTRYDPGESEARVFARWLDSGRFHPEPAGTAAENYSIAIPPPNVTGALHMGHALNGSIQDTLIRYDRMRGKRTKWILGTDHAGIATQTQVERLLESEGTSREEIGREAFIERVWRWREQYGGTIIDQYKRLGASCDYDEERFTLDEAYVRAVLKVFVALYEKGLIYRDNYMVNWDPGSRSAISDLEVEDREVTDTLYYVDYPLASGHGSITVATVRPETMLGDTAIAVHPDDDRYTRLVGETAILPIVGRRLRIIADDYVKPEFGTGALKITPGHDPNDFEIGRKHGLEELTVIGEDGRMTEAAGERFAGLTALEAREAVVAALREEGRINRTEPYTHEVPYSQRSGERIEPLISLQWFMKMDELAAPAHAAVAEGRVRIHPEGQRRRYLDWLENIRPWCISRQLWWGHRIPVWYRGDETYVGMDPPDGPGLGARPRRAGHVVLERAVAVRDARLAGRDRRAEGLLPDRRAADGARHPVPVGRPHGLHGARVRGRHPVRRRLRALGRAGAGRAPDVEVARHGHRPAGADRRRPAPAGVHRGRRLPRLRRRRRPLRPAGDVLDAGRALQRGHDRRGPPAREQALQRVAARAAARARGRHGARRRRRTPATVEDTWILSRLQAAEGRRRARRSRASSSTARRRALYGFVYGELCDWYLEMLKPRLYDEDNAATAEFALHVLAETLALAHPVIPFVTEEIWSLPARPEATC